jgi:putative endopeptidase
MRRSPFIAAAFFCAGCSMFASNPQPPPAAPQAQPALGAWGVDLTNMDRSVKPGDNFFLFANGTWVKNAVIPPERASAGSFQDLQILSEKRMKEIMADLDAKPYQSMNDEEKKLRDLYDAFEDTNEIDMRGLGPAKKDLAYLSHLKTLTDVARAMGSVPLSLPSVFNASIIVDKKNTNAYVIGVGQGGLGLPDRDYYLRDDKDLAATREAYKKYLTDMLTLAGEKDAAARAAKIFALETEIAKVSWARADRRNATKVYNPMSFGELKKFAPGFPWDANFKESSLPTKAPTGDRRVIVAEKSALPALAKIFVKTPVPVWRDYLTVHYMHEFADYLPKQIDDTDFAFYGTVLAGKTQQLDRPARGAHLVDIVMGEALGKVYAARYFPPEARAKAQALVANILKAYEGDLKTLSWMSDETRQRALDKLHAFVPHIGYPDQWRDYSALSISRSDLIGDVERSNVFDWNRQTKRLDDPVDKNEWVMSPPTVNAYYRPDFNAIFFPAAIFQPPFFDPNADDAVNYGGIGVVIGHEISHGFDDQGSKSDGQGQLNNWWTDADRAAFDDRTKRLGEQFDSYEPLPGMHIIGANTMGENVADLAGLNISFKAYHISLEGKTAPVLDSFTGDQRFFLGFAQVWRAKYRDSAMRAQILSNAHSPGEFRVIGPTRNTDAWYDAFSVQAGDKYYLPPDQRVRLW